MTITSNNKSLNLNAIIKIIVFISQIDIDAGNYIMIKLFVFIFFILFFILQLLILTIRLTLIIQNFDLEQVLVGGRVNKL